MNVLKRKTLKKITLKDLAEETGYSINTISRALKNKKDISPETCKQIQKLAKERGYIPDVIAGSLRSKSTKTIAVVLSDISNPYFGIVVKGIEDTARKRGYHIIIANTDEIYEIEEEMIRTLMGKRIDGFIILPTQTNSADIQFLKDRGIPLILLGRYFKDLDTSYLITDDAKGGYLATKYLIEKGHRRILVITGPQYISCARERLQGYLRAMEEAGLPMEKEMICKLSNIRGLEGRHRFLELLKDHQFTAVFAFSDYIAFQVLYTLEENGLRSPEDIAVVGYDNVQASLFFPRPLTTINIPIYEMGKRATEILLNKIESREETDDQEMQIVYDVELVIRNTA